jgi:HEAT repeat protein
VRYGAALALGGTCDPTAASALLAARDDRSPAVRTAVLYALFNLNDPRAIPSLIQALGDRDARVRSYAARLLTKTTGEPFGDDADKWREWWEKQPAKNPNP